MIRVNQFTKIYHLSKKQMRELKQSDSKKTAVDNISFSAEKGEIFGLLGPNGAGKTTTLRSIATLLKPTEGEILVEGFSVKEDSQEIRRRIGFLTNELKLDKHFTPRYTMQFFGKLYGLKSEAIKEKTDELFAYFGINEFADKKIGELSTGMSQKLSIAVSLVHDPDVIIFDEPTNGLDVITARSVTDYLFELKRRGKLVIISTHIMSVAEKLCDRLAIIINGKIVAEGTVAQVLEKTMTQDLEEAFFKLYSKAMEE